MSRLALPFEVADLSAFAKSLRTQLSALDHQPSHVELLNLICQSAGYRNYQHFRAADVPRKILVGKKQDAHGIRRLEIEPPPGTLPITLQSFPTFLSRDQARTRPQAFAGLGGGLLLRAGLKRAFALQ